MQALSPAAILRSHTLARVKLACLYKLVVLLSAALPIGAHAFPVQYANALQRTTYTLYTGDYNGDSKVDLLAKARNPMVLVDYDIPIPVRLKPPSPSFALLSSGDAYSLVSSPSASLLASPVWQPAPYDVAFGDVQANGSVAMVLRGRNPQLPGFTVVTSATDGSPSLLQVLSSATLGIDISAAGTALAVADKNNDGRADLTVSVNGSVSVVFLADAAGRFVRSEEGTIRGVWAGMMGSLAANNPSGALAYIADESWPKYQAAFTALGPQIRDVAASLSDLEMVEMTAKYARFITFQTHQGVTRMHFISFVKRGDAWMLAEF